MLVTTEGMLLWLFMLFFLSAAVEESASSFRKLTRDGM